jgi:hypothetical protein
MASNEQTRRPPDGVSHRLAAGARARGNNIIIAPPAFALLMPRRDSVHIMHAKHQPHSMKTPNT